MTKKLKRTLGEVAEKLKTVIDGINKVIKGD